MLPQAPQSLGRSHLRQHTWSTVPHAVMVAHRPGFCGHPMALPALTPLMPAPFQQHTASLVHARRPRQVLARDASGINNSAFLMATAYESPADDLPVMSPQESALVEQLQALLELSVANTEQTPPSVLTQQLGVQLVTTSQQATSPPTNLLTDTLADEAEDGGGDGMAAPSAVSLPSSSSGSSSSAGQPGSSNKGFVGWGQSALAQLQARKAFMALHGLTDADAPRQSTSSWSKPPPSPPRFDPMDTFEDDEDGYGFEAALPPLPTLPKSGPSLWNRGANRGKSGSPSLGAAAGFLGNMSSRIASKVASKVGGISKAAAKKVAQSVEPLANGVALTSDAAAAVMGSASRAAKQSVLGKGATVVAAAASGAVAAAAPAVQAARSAVGAAATSAASATVKSAVNAAKSANARLMELGGGAKSTWVVVDCPPGSVPGADEHMVRVIVVSASPDLTKTIIKMQQQQTTSGLMSFESYKLGVKVPKAVYEEAGSMYTTLLPLIMDFIAEHPKGKICFTGTGAGGSMATVLGLMAASRGLRQHCMLPLVVAFDAPPVLAEVVSGALWGCGGQSQDACQAADWDEMVADVTARGLLTELGLPRDAVLTISRGSAPQAASSKVNAQADAGSTTSALMAAASAAARRLSKLMTAQRQAGAGAGAGQAAGRGVPPGSSSGFTSSVDEDSMGVGASGGVKEPGKGGAGAAGSGEASRQSPPPLDASQVSGAPQLQLFKLVGQVRVQH